MSDDHLYHLEPLPDHLHRRAALEGTGYHVISKRSTQDLLNRKFMSAPIRGIVQLAFLALGRGGGALGGLSVFEPLLKGWVVNFKLSVVSFK